MRGIVVLGVVLSFLLSGERLWGDTPESTGTQKAGVFWRRDSQRRILSPTIPMALSIALRDYRGRPVIINFWATWCAPCRQEMRDLQTVYDAHKAAGLMVLAVSQDQQDKRRGDTCVLYSFRDHLPTAPGPRWACGHPLQCLLAPEHGVHSPVRDSSGCASWGHDAGTDRAVPAGHSAPARVGSPQA